MQRTEATPRLQIVRANRRQNLYYRKLAVRSCDIFSLCSSKPLYPIAMHAAQESVYGAAPTYVVAVQPGAKLFSTACMCILKLWRALIPSAQALHRADLWMGIASFLTTPVLHGPEWSHHRVFLCYRSAELYCVMRTDDNRNVLEGKHRCHSRGFGSV